MNSNHVSEGLKRLNSHEPKFPTDTYFIKTQKKLFNRYSTDHSLIDELEEKATPRLKFRIKMFGVVKPG